MRQAWPILLICVVCAPTTASAGNSDEVNAGLDVTLTGGAVVATTYTGAALWYNPGRHRADQQGLPRAHRYDDANTDREDPWGS